MTENKKSNRKNRGEVSTEEINKFLNHADIELIELLKSSKPAERTCAAKILGNRKSETAIPALCSALKSEKSLYSKIAISEALGEIGLAALPVLIKILGKIGNNQHKELPVKSFNKWNYPLPRDIAARTITKIGENALELLINSLPDLDKESLSEAIDAIGFISFYAKNHFAFEAIKKHISQYQEDDLVFWKLIRALQSFPINESIEILEFQIQHHSQMAIRSEAERSLAQINRCFKIKN